MEQEGQNINNKQTVSSGYDPVLHHPLVCTKCADSSFCLFGFKLLPSRNDFEVSNQILISCRYSLVDVVELKISIPDVTAQEVIKGGYK